MDWKVIKNNHLDKPPHQRWLYKLADIGLIKALMLIWGICLLVLVVSLLLVKAILAHFK